MIIELVISTSGPTYYTQGRSNCYVTIQISITVVQKIWNYVGVSQYVKYPVPSCNAMCKNIYHHSYLHPHVHVYRHRNMCTIQNTTMNVLSRPAHIHIFSHENIHAHTHIHTCMSMDVDTHTSMHLHMGIHKHPQSHACMFNSKHLCGFMFIMPICRHVVSI